MKRYSLFTLIVITALLLLSLFSGCKKSPPAVSRAPSPAPPPSSTPAGVDATAPSIDLSVSPASIQRGDQATLSWQTQEASSVRIDNGVGNVGPTGSLAVSPRESVTYTAVATGPGGDNRASARLTVLDRSDRGDVQQDDIRNLREAIERQLVKPVFFAYDSAELTGEARQTLEDNARIFRRYPDARIMVEGHCDERGTEEYNLALGDRRAQAARQYLLQLGVDAGRLQAISFGEERPFAMGQTEAAFAQNRRAHFSVP